MRRPGSLAVSACGPGSSVGEQSGRCAVPSASRRVRRVVAQPQGPLDQLGDTCTRPMNLRSRAAGRARASPALCLDGVGRHLNAIRREQSRPSGSSRWPAAAKIWSRSSSRPGLPRLPSPRVAPSSPTARAGIRARARVHAAPRLRPRRARLRRLVAGHGGVPGEPETPRIVVAAAVRRRRRPGARADVRGAGARGSSRRNGGAERVPPAVRRRQPERGGQPGGTAGQVLGGFRRRPPALASSSPATTSPARSSSAGRHAGRARRRCWRSGASHR